MKTIMRLHVMSDLHLEHHRDGGKSFIESLPDRKDTILILAGDITSFKRPEVAEAHLGALAIKYKHTLYIPGNHEYYGSSVQHTTSSMAVVAGRLQDFTVLSAARPAVIDGKRFVGDTLWFQYLPTNRFHERELTDFSLIKQFKPWVYDMHDETVRQFEKNLQPGDVIVTHHMPHPKSIHPKYYGDSINCFFLAADLTTLIEKYQPALWIHGHTHETFDYVVGGTRIVCNPRGYPSEKTDSVFNDSLIIEV